RHRKLDREGRARTAPDARGADRAAVRLDDAAADREPQPEPGAAYAAARLLERLEDALEVLGLDAAAGVDHVDAGAAVASVGLDAYRAARGGVANGVAEQVPEHLAEPRAVAAHERLARIELHVERELRAVEVVHTHVDRVPDRGVEVHDL